MANLEKHKKNPVQEWLEGDESTLPAKSRSSHVLGAYIKIPRAEIRKSRRIAPEIEEAKPEPALAREAAPPSKQDEKRTQANSPEHLRKVSRIPNLRARFRPSPGARG